MSLLLGIVDNEMCVRERDLKVTIIVDDADYVVYKIQISLSSKMQVLTPLTSSIIQTRLVTF